ncbi:AurF N-oxygenase family protein [Nocardioides daejeonensis]|uniref:AurF N-oxygenase family protein n=1 Tax=Nocardioides daejeonensis TaxID=1046556 RepID=UPI000D74611C|nr:diiron oxygenase [Nocardioides daejeonensis]
MTISDPLSDRLLKSAARQSYDPEVDIDWDAEVVPGLHYMVPERLSLWGTPMFERLTPEQQIELSKHEIGSIASVGLWFEIILMQLLLRDVYHNDPRADRTHFELTEIADECRHSLMFGKALSRLGVPAYGPRSWIHRLAPIYPTISRGAAAYASILIGEEPVDRLQREIMHDDRVQPIVRQISRIHVVEEARHVSFARDELQKAIQGMSRLERTYAQTITAQGAYIMMRSLVHPDAYKSVGLDPREARKAALANPNYRATIAWMGEKVMPFLEECDMIGGSRNRRAWRASFLLP